MKAIQPGWRTARTSLRVLVVLHSLAAATRIADVLPVFHDPRVELFCTKTEGAVFPDGVDDFMESQGLHRLEWDEVRCLEFDLAIAASLGDNLHELKCPILRIPHGNGYNKRWGTGYRVPGTGYREPGTWEQRGVWALRRHT